ncbi:ArsR/SmtB family transcription factor [Nonomuraea wenchangensis]|uniref:ArsR/SmtB family transcription factor n=1 Tax=Nonomuraea wenchangensis TaxID=568860 RepID=UPI0033261B94
MPAGALVGDRDAAPALGGGWHAGLDAVEDLLDGRRADPSVGHELRTTYQRALAGRTPSRSWRQEILDLLRDGERLAGDLAADGAKHLNVLREAGLVEVRKRRSVAGIGTPGWRCTGGCGAIGSTERPWRAQSRGRGLSGPGSVRAEA